VVVQTTVHVLPGSLRPQGRCVKLALHRVALYALLSLAATWPLARQLPSHYPRGSEQVTTVPLVSAWALWWTSDRLRHGFADYWAAPIFHPAQDAFALSEPMPLLGVLAAPLCWLGLPLVLAYNLVLLAALVASGSCAEKLLRAQRLSRLASCAGGALVCVLPAVFHQLGVLTLVPLAGVLGCLHFALRIVRTARWQEGIGLGLSFAVAYTCCAQYALMVALALPVALACALGKRVRSRLPALALALVLAGGLLAPLVHAQRAAVQAHALVRSERRVREGSAAPLDYLRAPRSVLPPPPGVRRDKGSHTALYPGLLRFVLAVVGASFALRTRGRRRAATFLLAFALSSGLLSMSPRIALAGHSLHEALAAVVPGLAQVRSIWRAGVLAQLALTLLTAFGLHACWRRYPRASLALSLLALLEVWPAPQKLGAAPDERAYEPWARQMHALPAGAAYCLFPFESGSSVRGFEPIARFMALTRLHGRAMVNGYSSFFPAEHERLWSSNPRLGDPATAADLRALGVQYAVSYGPPSDGSAWPLLFRDAATGVGILRVP
jgi:hypothetical protein